LYKYDYNVTDAGYYFTYRTSNPADYVPLPFKPETHESDPHSEVFERFAWTINNTSDAAFRSAIAEFMDLTELIRHVASSETKSPRRDKHHRDHRANPQRSL